MSSLHEIVAHRGAVTLPGDRYDRELLEHTHPPEWTNPEPAARYHLVVIGGGTAGLVAAAGAAGLGARVALIERHLLGGDCLNAGCVPSKAMIRAARAAADVRDAAEFGVEVSGMQVDFAAVMERMRRLRAGLSPHDSAARFRDLGVDVFLGEARFTDRESVAVDGQTLRFRRALIATGSRAVEPPIPGLAEAGFRTNETIFTLTELPRRLAVVGGGPIGCELAQTFARLGSRVTLIEQSPGILPRDDRDAAELVHNALARDGVDIKTSCQLAGVESGGYVKLLQLKQGDSEQQLEADEILVGVGRAPNVESLDLKAAGVEYDRRQGVTVDDRLRTTNNRIFAAGDVCSRFKFTHAADALARIAIQNALFFAWAKASALTIPWCTYTSPEVAHVGWSPQDANASDIRTETFVQQLRDVDRAVLDGETEGFVKIHVRAGSDRIVGATVVAQHAGEMISELTTAIASGTGLKKLAGVIHPYPTQAEAVKKAADAYQRARLTPRLRGLLQRWFSWTT
jgi:pyruvate/2-oxoglutarate dehydrogenase complex dihydrolipoamide dehydrogenase (E3) component